MISQARLEEQSIGSVEMSNVDAVSNILIRLHREIHNESLSPMKLQKLLYYAQGHHLASLRKPLFDEDFQAWAHGPVIPQIYKRFRNYEWRQISEQVEYVEMDEESMDVLSSVVKSYGQFDGAYLSTMTHRESPWIDARQGLSPDSQSTNLISKDALISFFALQSQQPS